MNKARISLTLLFLAVVACGAPKSISPEPSAETNTPAAVPAATLAPSATATLEASLTPTPALLPLEIVEWAEYPYANLADPQNTDTRVEILIRNPNDFPVRVDRDKEELRLLNADGEIVYTNANPVFYIWEGSWILGGETAAMSACVCFWTDGVEKQGWESLELVAPLEPATGIAYTTDVEVTVGEFFSLAEAHLGGDELGAEITLVNTGSQILRSYEVRVIARDPSGKYVGVAIYGSFVPDFLNPEADIEPGTSGGGVVVSEIDYVDGPLVYEVTAIGIPAGK
ncbi:MAG TPA: hypothetical protein VFI68_04845 [Anaerolineales bacterium]|nr:hypothetical protein [Anaerolineales bacterium]